MSARKITIELPTETECAMLTIALAETRENYPLKAEYEVEPYKTHYSEWSAAAEQLRSQFEQSLA